ncbi:hypothetical protein QT381_09075 [Galbitalea sp. SE-J8]|uniref:hypothetical protein n=1 Tax=Galbitalea sp. SE-J8 TaxID=3054952 RepID=UPI00259D0451|nr:hypothetical protein [Galbitalea sp. SE-J8]MDM4763160.1 hypothetical protein [Galbitalea sp. SE-J8]
MFEPGVVLHPVAPPHVDGPSSAAPRAVSAGSTSGTTDADARAERVRELQDRIRSMQATTLAEPTIPTHPAIAGLLPGGGLKQGSAYSVDSSATLLMALLAGPSAAGSWCGVIGVPEFGVEAAARFGVDLERLALVPHPGDQWLAVTAAVADVLDVVVVRPGRRAGDASIARLAARLRQRGVTLLVQGAWPQTEAMLSLGDSAWTGIGEGHGYLEARQATVTVTTRTAGRPRSARLWLPDARAEFRAVESETPALRPVAQRAGAAAQRAGAAAQRADAVRRAG